MEEFPVDLAVTYIDPASWDTGDRSGVPIELVAEQFAPVEHELLFIAGHPGELSKFQNIPGDVKLKSNRALYLARESPLPTGFDPAIHFAMQYEMKKAKATDGSSHRLPNPTGLSGSAIWDTGFTASGYSEKWNSGSARMVGIAQRWLEDESCIIGTKAEAVRRFLLEQVKGDLAYHHWITRGRPDGCVAEIDVQYAHSIATTLKSE